MEGLMLDGLVSGFLVSFDVLCQEVFYHDIDSRDN